MLQQPVFLLVWQCGLLDHRRLGIDCLADRLAQHRNDLGFSSIPGIALQSWRITWGVTRACLALLGANFGACPLPVRSAA